MDKSVERVDNLNNSRSKNPVNKQILGIFAKQPLPGQVKTRLCPPLSAAAAANLYLISLQETVARMKSVTDCDLALCYRGEERWFAETFPGITLVPQRGADLGARMAERLSAWLVSGYDAVVLIGSDAPDLPCERIEQAFAALTAADLVHGPAVDGGYYLVGESTHRPELYSRIAWSTGKVLEQTLKKAAQLGLRSVLLEEWDDLDNLPALLRLLQRSPDSRTAVHISALLAALQDNLT